ncbi:type I-F CRISPR-associated protein Csy3 [Klebsiella oxytoca]|uniref:type I-F CRISPR-associated protein Csy3 n=1 Tax=Klebsiella oxytoca TaxID=571 RepID=UPI003571743F
MELCTLLNYRRSLSPGKAVFYFKTENNDFVPLRIEVAKINGQKCSFSEGFESNFSPKNIMKYHLAYGNPHTLEFCYVPPDVSEIYCRVSVRIEANSLRPNVCSDPDVMRTLMNLAERYKEHYGYRELARRYSMNILMGTWLWRNRYTQGTQIEIRTSLNSFYCIPDCRWLSWSNTWPKHETLQLEQLTIEIANALSQPNIFWFADITARLNVSFCQEIYPSQKFVEKSSSHDRPSRQLATTILTDGRQAACINAQKIGAGLQIIDDWWSDDADQPLRVHEFGADREGLTSRRHPVSNKDFYHLLSQADTYVNELEVYEKATLPLSRDLHYLMAVLVKGGLFHKGKTG